MTCGTLYAHSRALFYPFSPFYAASRSYEVQEGMRPPRINHRRKCVVSCTLLPFLQRSLPVAASDAHVTCRNAAGRPYGVGFLVTGAGPHQPHLYELSPNGPPSTRRSSAYPSRLARRVLRPTSRRIPSPVPTVCTSMSSFHSVG